VAPFDQGSPITGYKVQIRQSDGVTFTEDLTDCNRLAMPTLSCTVPVITLTTTPFEILWGEHIWAQVIAINAYGYSAVSDAGNGAEIITYPDSPISLVEDFAQRTYNSVTLNWQAGAEDGGSTVISYQLTYDNTSVTDFVILEDTIVSNFFKVENLTPGSTYKFKVQSRNSFGLSAYSLELELTVGFKPA
jgi:hypothetical protein